ncbi:MAG: ASKHA domain-containing protein [Dehalococcoidia bacterium]|nr:ASKHA domain-containing protein [Dehalococcoidia bacterium]
MAEETSRISFLPTHAVAEVPNGTLLLDAAEAVGIHIDIPCGGQGRCGRCKVKIENGRVEDSQNPHLTDEQVREGWVLSCSAMVAGDALITVPPPRVRERVTDTAANRTAVTVHSNWPLDPAVRGYYIELNPPSLADNMNDLDRVLAALKRRYGLGDMTVGLANLQRLSSTLRASEWKVTAVVEQSSASMIPRLLDLRAGDTTEKSFGAAVDIGTTTVVVYLTNLKTGELLDRASAFNRQISRGEDVISRIIFSQRGNGLHELQSLVLETLNELLAEVCRPLGIQTAMIDDMVVAGNTTMTQLFFGLDPKTIREEPYIPTTVHYPPIQARELGVAINPNASVYALPCVAAYVGGDITAGVLGSETYKADVLTLFMDVGTNGEMVLGNADWLMTCACSAGPAFEGAGVRSGMRAISGAIEDVRVSSRTFEPTFKVIDEVKPLGLCGSGMISAIAEMFITGILDRSGKMTATYARRHMRNPNRLRSGDHGNEYVIVFAENSGTGEDIVLTEVDVDNLIRTKAAIFAGITSLVNGVGVRLEDIEQVLIGGAFGQHIDIEQAIQIGLLPDLPWDKFKFLGNTSALGAFNALLSREARVKTNEIASKMTYLELIADNSYMNEFMSALFLPHTNLDAFPAVRAVLDAAEHKTGRQLADK